MVITPDGPGRFIEYDHAKGKVVVEMDWQSLVEYDADKVYVEEVNVNG